MRSKYLRKLLELVHELDDDARHDKLDSESGYLRAVMKTILVAFWFYQIDELWDQVRAWKVRATSAFVTGDVFDLAANFLAVEMAEQAALEMSAEEKAAAEAKAGA